MKRIQLTNSSLNVLVDDKDYDFLNQFQWYAKKTDTSSEKEMVHAARNVTIGSKSITIRMHRLVTEADSDQRVFHINGDTLDNRRSNLQIRTLNPYTGRPDNAGFIGVHQRSTNTWTAEITCAGRTYQIGEFMDASQAAREYDTAAKKLYGSNATLNF